MKRILLVLTYLSFFHFVNSQDILGFSFEKYGVKDIPVKKVPVSYQSHPLGLKYKSLITEQYKKGEINFGGHYIVILWGAGSGLSKGVMVDVLNGKIHKLPLSYENSYRGTYHDQNNNILFNKHSSLFICYKSKANELDYNQVDLDYSFYNWNEASKLFTLITTKKWTTDVIDD
ncbi:MAG: hypothetical protein RLZZ417_381 [Bacteroidota bacterium]